MNKSEITAKNRALVYRALTDLSFRRELEANPARALCKKELSPANAKEVSRILATVKEIEGRINLIGDELLCANGGPCGIA